RPQAVCVTSTSQSEQEAPCACDTFPPAPVSLSVWDHGTGCAAVRCANGEFESPGRYHRIPCDCRDRSANPTVEPAMSLRLDVGVEPIAGYTLIRLLGQGGFGEVWEADAPGGVRVALKFIRLDSRAADPEQRALKLIGNIRHPHLLN